MRLNNDLDELKKPGPDADKLKYLRAAPKLRGYYSTGKHGKQYQSQYLALQDAIDRWFKAHASELGSIAGCLHANFVVNNAVPVSHEELMRGVAAGEERAGKGSILDALKALHPATLTSPDACPVLAGVSHARCSPGAQPRQASLGRPRRGKAAGSRSALANSTLPTREIPRPWRQLLRRKGGGSVLPSRGESVFLADARRCLCSWRRVGVLGGLCLLEHLPAFLRGDQLDGPQVAQRP